MASPSQATRQAGRRGGRAEGRLGGWPAAKKAAGSVASDKRPLRLRGPLRAEPGGAGGHFKVLQEPRSGDRPAAHGIRAPAAGEDQLAGVAGKSRSDLLFGFSPFLFPLQPPTGDPGDPFGSCPAAEKGGLGEGCASERNRRQVQGVQSLGLAGRRGRKEGAAKSEPAGRPGRAAPRKSAGRARVPASDPAAAAPPAKPARHRKRGGSAARQGFPAGRGITPPDDQSEGGVASPPSRSLAPPLL